MATLKVKDVSGKDAGTVELDDDMFAVQPNVPVMHQVVTAQLAARRSGTQSTKTRAEVSGGGRKPYAQKGTGNARQGSIRGPHFSGGGVALGPKPRKYDQKTPKKMVKLALKSALSDRANEGKIIVVDSWGIDSPKTKTAKLALDALGIDGTALVVVGRDDAAAAMSFRNLPKVQLIGPGELNAYDVLCNEYIVFTKDLVPVSVVGDGSATTEPAAKKPAAKKPAAKKPAAEKVVDVETAPYGAGSHAATEDDSEPKGFPIKGNADSMLYHGPDSPYYSQTVAEVWFATEEAAEAAGFSKPASVQAAEEAAEEAAAEEAAADDEATKEGA